MTLVEGSVEMETKLGGDDRIVRLRPGELVKLDKRTGSTRLGQQKWNTCNCG